MGKIHPEPKGAAMRWNFWIPGKFRLTDQMLSDLRAAGMAAAGRTAGKAPRIVDHYVREVREIRKAAAQVTRGAVHERDHGPFAIRIIVFGHRSHDPDAWYLLAREIVRGMVTSGFLMSPREIQSVAGRVLQTVEEENSERAISSLPVFTGALVRVVELLEVWGNA